MKVFGALRTPSMPFHELESCQQGNPSYFVLLCHVFHSKRKGAIHIISSTDFITCSKVFETCSAMSHDDVHAKTHTQSR